MAVEKTKNLTVFRFLLRVAQGAIIGVGAILPGISGGVLCVIFGIYQPMMALLAHPVKTFKLHAKLLLPVLIGWILGFVGLAKLVELMFKASYNLAVWFFIGLIAGMMPSLFKEAGRNGRPKSAWVSFAISFIAIFSFLLFIKLGKMMNIQPNIWWFLFCGALWGVSLVVPGMSSSSILIFMGLYEPMAAGIGKLLEPGKFADSLAVVVPLLVGIFLIVVIFARGVNYLFEKHYPAAYHIILGVVIASTLIIVPLEIKNYIDIAIYAACFAAGFIIAFVMDRIGQRLQAKSEKNT